METTSPVRYALYYPYIHIRDENWLKATILGFQQVRRIVPNRFTLSDQVITRAYSELEGPAGPLLRTATLSAPSVAKAQESLEAKILQRLEEIVRRYARTATPAEFQGGAKAFQIHRGKFLARTFADLLEQNELAWHSRDSGEKDSYDWLTLHPSLGAAVMTVLGLALAKGEGLDIVTPSERAHHVLLANREIDVFDQLLGAPCDSIPDGGEQPSVEELIQLVVTTGFDLTRLTAKDICELLREGKDLRRLREELDGFARRVPAGLNGQERIARMKTEVEAVLAEWRDYSTALPRFAKEALVDAVLEKAPEKVVGAAIEAGKTAVSTVIGNLPGLIISVVIAAGTKMYRKRDSPYRFLTRVENSVNRSIGSIYVPQWRKLAGSGEGDE